MVAVIAHEIGHLHNFHIAKRKDKINKINNLNKISNLSIFAGSLASNNSDNLLKSLVANNIGMHNYFQSFSREQEREADYYAVRTLNKMNLSKEPLIKFLNFLEKESIKNGIPDEYYKFASHPIWQQRYDIVNENKMLNKSKFDKITNLKFKYIRAKLFGFTEIDYNSIEKNLNEDFLIYAHSIMLSKKGQLKESLKLINNLIQKKQNHSFILETKGDILYSNGFLKESMLFYEENTKKYPENFYAKKRIFDIKFSLLKNNKKIQSKKIFNENKYLLTIFFNNIDLRNKLKELAIQIDDYNWKKYFAIIEKLNKKNSKNKKLKEEIELIKKNTLDKILIKLINKHIKELHINE